MVKGQNIEDRLVDFAVAIIGLCESMPASVAARQVAGQLLRSGTAPAPNYAEARGAESRRDFIHKVRIALKELNETAVWLRIAERSRLVPVERIARVQAEAHELARILNASISTARANEARSARTGLREPEVAYVAPVLAEARARPHLVDH